MINELYVRYYCRSDCIDKLPNQIEFLNDLLYKTKNKLQQINILQTLSFITRFQPSHFILPVLNLQKFAEIRNTDNREMRKLIVILSMRICTRQLQIALLNNNTKAIVQSLPQSFDFFIDTLLKLLDTSEPTTRQISAISLAKVASLLPELFKDELIDELFSYISPEQTPETYSGILITLGELTRLGGIQQKEQINQMLQLLLNTQNTYFGNKTSIVQDSLAFCLWCISRSDINREYLDKKLIQQLAGNISSQSLLSFNLTTRRTSAAAFQQMCGQLGQNFIPQAILAASIPDFCQISDFYFCYQDLALKLCKLDTLYSKCFIQYILDNIVYIQEFDKQKLMGKLLGQLITDDDLQLINEQIIQLLQNNEDFICQNASSAILYGCKNINLDWIKIKDITIQLIQQLNKLDDIPQYQILQSFALILTIINDRNIELNQEEIQIINEFCTKYFKQTLTKHLNVISLTTYHIIYKNVFLKLIRQLNEKYNLQFNIWQENSIKSALSCCQLLSVDEYQYLFDKSRDPITNINRLYMLESIQIHKDKLMNEKYNNFLIEYLKFCTNDFSVDKRGEIGQQVRHKTLQVLRDIIQYNQFYNQQQKQEIQNIYINCILLACSSRSDYLKLDGIMNLKYLLNLNNQLLNQKYKLELDKYLTKPQIQTQNSNKQQFDINDLTNDELKKQIDEQNSKYIKSSYIILNILCKSNKQWAYIIYRQLVYDITFCNENELQQTLNLIKLQQENDFYQFLIEQFDIQQQNTYQLGMNYAIIVTIQFLIYYEYKPNVNLLKNLLNLIEKFLNFNSINFYSFSASFNIYTYIINYLENRELKLYCKQQLIKYLQDSTLKLRQQASEAIIECCLLNNQNDIINLLLEQDIMNLKLGQCQILMKNVQELWL